MFNQFASKMNAAASAAANDPTVKAAAEQGYAAASAVKNDPAVKAVAEQGFVAASAAKNDPAAKAAASHVRDAAWDAALDAFKKTVIRTYGDEVGNDVWDGLVAINKCEEIVLEEVGYKSKAGLLLALPLVSLEHNEVPRTMATNDLADDIMLREARYWLDYADAAYGDNAAYGTVGLYYDEGKERMHKAKVAAKLRDKNQEVLLANVGTDNVSEPGYFVAVDVGKKVVVLGIRGTASPMDAITDGVANSVRLPESPDVEAHQGILEGARAVLRKTFEELEKVLENNTGFSVHVCGHSLGAGVAILCTLLLHLRPLKQKPKVRCFAYAPPPVVTPLSADCVSCLDVSSYINRNDIIPRLSLRNALLLALESKAVNELDLGVKRLDLASEAIIGSERLNRASMAMNGTTPTYDIETQQKVKQAISNVRGTAPSTCQKIAAHFIPGKVMWIDPDSSPAKMHITDASQFQEVYVRALPSCLTDHKTGSYRTSLNSVIAATNTDSKGRVPVSMAQTPSEGSAPIAMTQTPSAQNTGAKAGAKAGGNVIAGAKSLFGKMSALTKKG